MTALWVYLPEEAVEVWWWGTRRNALDSFRGDGPQGCSWLWWCLSLNNASTCPITCCHIHVSKPHFRSRWSLEEPGAPLGKERAPFPRQHLASFWQVHATLSTLPEPRRLSHVLWTTHSLITFEKWNASIPPPTDLVTNKNSRCSYEY